MDDKLEPRDLVELAALRAEYQKKFQTMIAFIKDKVGEGVEYRNDIVRVVVSENGAYYELLDLPEEFAGAASAEVQRHFMAPREANALLARVVAAIPRATPANTRHFSLIVLYNRRGLVDRKNCYIYEFHANADHPDRPASEIGHFRPDALPLFFKVKLDADYAQEVLEIPRGIVFCMANAGDRNLLIRIPFTGESVTDLNDLPTSTTVH